MLIEKEKLEEAKMKIGDRNAELIAEILGIEDYDERNMRACCPFHGEDTPSFIYNKKAFNFKCFGCGKTIDLFDAIMFTGATFINACKKVFEYAEMDYSFGEEGVRTKSQYRYPNEIPVNDKKTVYEYLKKRGISQDVIDYLDIREENGNCVFNYYDTNDVLTTQKLRPARSVKKGDVKIWCAKDKDTTPLLFNMNRINTSQPLLITEGEFDAASAVQAGYFNTTSVPFGAGNFSWIEENFEWLEQFDSIIIASDNDAAGEKMRQECIYRLGSWRTKVAEYPKEKIVNTDDGGVKRIPISDMNDTLQAFGEQYVLSMIVNAKDTPVESVVDFSEIEDIDVSNIDGIYTGIDVLDKELMRLFYGSFNLVSGINGSGKSSFLGQLSTNSIEQGKNVWMYSKELPNYMSKNWINSIFAGPRNVDEHVNNTGSKYYTVKQEAKKRISDFYKDTFYLYKDSMENTVENIQKSMTDCARKFGCKLFIIDNLTAINFECSDNEKWSKQVELVNWLISFAQKFHVVVILVIHPKKIETYRRLTKFDVQGLGSIVDLCHRLISLYRVQKKEKEGVPKRNGQGWEVEPVIYDVYADVLKDRLRGKEGLEVGMFYDNGSRRFFTTQEEYDLQYSWDKNTYTESLEYPIVSRENPFY